MPNPLDFLTTPIISKQAIKPTQDLIENPSKAYGPVESRVRGFASGALEGLRGLTTPLDIGSAILPELAGLGKGAKAVSGLSRSFPESMTRMAAAWEPPSFMRKAVSDIPDIKDLPQSIQDLMHPQAGKMMDQMFQEANPTFQKMERSGMFSDPARTIGQGGVLKNPTAKYLGKMEDLDLYNIEGGPRHGSTVSRKTLQELGIPIPEAR